MEHLLNSGDSPSKPTTYIITELPDETELRVGHLMAKTWLSLLRVRLSSLGQKHAKIVLMFPYLPLANRS